MSAPTETTETTETTMRPFHARRLLKLADKLEGLNRAEFHMGMWGVEDEKSPCGTAACALGWAGLMPEFRRVGLMPEFRRVGLKTEVAESESYSGGEVRFRPERESDKEFCRMANREDREAGHHAPSMNSYRREHAGRRFFGLSRTEADSLFFPHKGHRTPKQVARHIRGVVKKHHPDLA